MKPWIMPALGGVSWPLCQARAIGNHPFPCVHHPRLIDRSALLYQVAMAHVCDQMIPLQDRARLRERFFGATRSVLACL